MGIHMAVLRKKLSGEKNGQRCTQPDFGKRTVTCIQIFGEESVLSPYSCIQHIVGFDDSQG